MIQSDTPACRKEYGTSARGLVTSSAESAFSLAFCHTSATLAHAFDVSIGDLIGEPTLLEWSKDSGRRALPALREALMDYRQLAPLIGTPDAGEAPTLAALRSDVREVWDAYQDSRYGFAARPPLAPVRCTARGLVLLR
ncbi:hypothetical protein [Streptomyces tubercidicus]|uniref:hypothetical protein n=1 Tax=Streptomyces tubercidicus TaxID=47759 RepID=UPI0036AF772F